ncbi:MAG: DUF167 domain-containing protein [Desulfobacteraceae bacterium]|nr:DUF167 domain-containing protein [Desulfobacteraceae bacterium]
MITFTESENALVFGVYVQPRSSSCNIVGKYQNALKIKLTAPPVGGAANKQCIEVLAKALKLPKSALSITSGSKNRMKKIKINTSGFSDQTEFKKRITSRLATLSSEKQAGKK